MPFLLAYTPGVAADMQALDPDLRARVIAFITHMARREVDPGGLLARENEELAGIREAFIAPEQKNAPEVALLYTIHPGPHQSSPPVLNVVAAGQPRWTNQLLGLREEAAKRLRPPGHAWSRTIDPGFGRDIKAAPKEVQAAAWATINAMTRGESSPGRDPLSGQQLPTPVLSHTDPSAGKELGNTSGLDLRGVRGMSFDTLDQGPSPKNPRFGLVYRILPPPEGSNLRTIHILGAGRRQSAQLLINAAKRVGTLKPQIQRLQTRSRAAAARQAPTTGAAPQESAASTHSRASRPRAAATDRVLRHGR